jgi:hypothetical protein
MPAPSLTHLHEFASVCSFLGAQHPYGPGVHPLPAPDGVELVGITDEQAAIRIVVIAEPGALDASATVYMRSWWRDRFRALARRALLRVL